MRAFDLLVSNTSITSSTCIWAAYFKNRNPPISLSLSLSLCTFVCMSLSVSVSFSSFLPPPSPFFHPPLCMHRTIPSSQPQKSHRSKEQLPEFQAEVSLTVIRTHHYNVGRRLGKIKVADWIRKVELHRKTSWQLAKHAKPNSELHMTIPYKGWGVEGGGRKIQKNKHTKSTQQQAYKTRRRRRKNH